MASLQNLALVVALASCTTTSPPAGIQSRDCVDHAPNEYKVDVTGRGFADASTVHVLTDIRLVSAPDVTCRIAGAAPVSSGGFAVELANLTDTAAYPFVGAFIDRDGDGACSAADLTWSIYGETVDPAFMVDITPEQFSAGDPGQVCAHFASTP